MKGDLSPEQTNVLAYALAFSNLGQSMDNLLDLGIPITQDNVIKLMYRHIQRDTFVDVFDDEVASWKEMLVEPETKAFYTKQSYPVVKWLKVHNAFPGVNHDKKETTARPRRKG